MQKKISSFVSYISVGIVASLGALTFQDWMSAIGLSFVIMTYLTNCYYKKKSDEQLKANLDKVAAYEKLID